MANLDTLKNDLVKKKENGVGKAGNTVKGILDSPGIKRRFEEVLDKKAPQFMSSIINLVNGDTNLKKVDQMSVIASAMVAATLDLPVDKNLGCAWIIPYGNKAQFILGYKGYIQLAYRTGIYKKLNAFPVYESEFKSWNKVEEELILDTDVGESGEVVGYGASFETVNGMKKTVYWTKDQVIKHKNRFSKSGNVWKTDFDAMALKTVLKNLLSKWGPLSIEMQMAQTSDTAVVNETILEPGADTSDAIEYIDTDYEIETSESPETSEEVDLETGEIIPAGI